MDEGKIAIRYAKAVMSLAKEQKQSESVKTDMELIAKLFEQLPDFHQILESPVISGKQKHQLFETVFSSSLSPLTFNFLLLLLANRRESYLRMIVRIYLETHRKEAGYKEGQLTSAAPIHPETLEQLHKVIRKHFRTEVDLTCKVDPKLIGGFVLQVEDQQIDASVASKLVRLKRELLASQR